MANTSTNVSTGKPNISGAVYYGVIGTATDPQGTTVAANANYTCLGYVSEDGLENDNAKDTEEIKEWGGLTVIRSITGVTDNFSLKLIESLNADVLKVVYGASNVSVATDGHITVTATGDDPDEYIWVFELEMRDGATKQIVIADGAVTECEPIVYNSSEAVGYGVTITAYPNSSGETHKEYITPAS